MIISDFMDILFKIEKENLEQAKNLLLSDDIVSRGSITFKEGSSLGLKENGYYCYLSGTDKICKKAKELVKDLTKLIEGKNKDKIIKEIKNEEQKAMEGFGAIFG
jgi:hypothetical protein